jgi:hypothetical protein
MKNENDMAETETRRDEDGKNRRSSPRLRMTNSFVVPKQTWQSLMGTTMALACFWPYTYIHTLGTSQ